MSTNKKVKTAALLLLVAVNSVYFFVLREQRAEVPAIMRPWQPLAERTSEEREQVVASSFALDDFDIKPLVTESEFVTIPRPKEWLEQMIHSTSFIRPESIVKGSSEGADTNEDNESSLLSNVNEYRMDLISVNVFHCETVQMPEGYPTVMKEKVVSRDAYMISGGILVPVLELMALNVYYVVEKDNSLRATQTAVRVNGQGMNTALSDIPQWLVPNRKLAIGETWVQVGALPTGVPDTAPRPEVVRELKRLVMFEGLPAAEISTTSTFYAYPRSPEGTPTKFEEEGVAYLDLETGEPLWYYRISKNNRKFTSLTRGCNQKFTKHLIRTSR